MKVLHGTTKYYYKISISTYYTRPYSIVYYEGNNSYGYLYITTDYTNLAKPVKMTEISIISRTSLPTISSEDKYFYLTNRHYLSDSSKIYICLEYNNFGLSYNNIKYCFTDIDPRSDQDNVIKSCSFSTISYLNTQNSSNITKYYYKISATTSYTYLVVYYEGNYSSGNLYVTSDFNEFFPTIKMTQVNRNSRTSLPTSSSNNKYFYLTNSIYSNYSSYIYFCLEDNNFGLSYNNIIYCCTNINPYTYPDIAIKNCTFTTISYYNTQSSSDTTKYYYNISTAGSYTYSIIYYQGSYSSGNLYVTSDYKNISSDDKSISSDDESMSSDDKSISNNGNKGISTVVIICIVAGSVVILVAFIIIIYCFCPCCGKNKKDIIPITQPSYYNKDSFEYSLNQTEALLPNDKPNIPLQRIHCP